MSHYTVDTHYALDGESVSTCTTFSSDYEFIPQELLILFCATCGACLIAQASVGGKFTEEYHHTSVVNHQSISLLIGFLLLLTTGTIVAEIWSYATWISQSCYGNSELLHYLVLIL